jgi:RimJ/RimL family protein N-acetyltransferase
MRVESHFLREVKFLMEIVGERCRLRPWRLDDKDALVAIANDRDIWMNMTSAFPHPYTAEDGEEWLARCQEAPISERCLAIEITGRLAGEADYTVGKDVSAHIATIGYWLGKEFWGRGIATEAVRLLTDHAFKEGGVTRCQANVFGWNPASGRVLEKAGYTCEGVLRKGILKDRRYTDLLMYGCLRED